MLAVEKMDVTIANGAAISGAIQVADSNVVGLLLPAAWTAAGIAFHVSYDGTTYVQLMVEDKMAAPPYGLDEYEILAADVPIAESVYIPLDPAIFLGVLYLKVRSQTAGTPVNQGAARTLGVMVRNLGY
jgi:hypothetical protein